MTTDKPMQLGMIGLGRMGANIVRRCMKDGHTCVVYDPNSDIVEELAKEGATPASSPEDFVAKLDTPRNAWVMVPAGEITEGVVKNLGDLMEAGDAIIDGGNSRYHDDLRRAAILRKKGIHFVDCGTSGGVWGLERGYCLMIGGDDEAVDRLVPIWDTVAPGPGDAPRTEGRTGPYSPEERGWLHCGPNGAGHYVKMVHNGIEYGVMAAYAEGLNILKHADAGDHQRDQDAETAPLENPDWYKYKLDLTAVAEVWRRGSVIGSWLLDLTAAALYHNGDLSEFSGRVSDSGEGRWTIQAAVDTSAPAPVLTAALYSRFESRGEALFADKVMSAMRKEFGGHDEKKD